MDKPLEGLEDLARGDISAEEVQRRFGMVRPDEVAECWEGVCAVPGLYRALWALEREYTAPPPEVSEEPCHGMDCVAQFWDKLSPEHRAALVRLDDEQERPWL